MSITVKITDHTPELMQKMDAAIGRFVVKGAAFVEGQWKADMASGAKSGKRYGKHIASAPGESPAVDSSNYINSLHTIIAANRLEAKVGTPLDYPLFLEYGTSKMAARPVVEKTAKESLPTLENILQSEIAKAKGH